MTSGNKFWIDYDQGADVLYISFVYPPNAVEHEEDENGIIKNYDDKGELDLPDHNCCQEVC